MTQPLTAGTSTLPGATSVPAEGTPEDAAQTAAAFESLLLALTGTPLPGPPAGTPGPTATGPTGPGTAAIGAVAGAGATSGIAGAAAGIAGAGAVAGAGVAGPLDPSTVPEAPRGMDAPSGTVGGQPAARPATGLPVEPVRVGFGPAAPQAPDASVPDASVPGTSVPDAAVPAPAAGTSVLPAQTTPAGATDAAPLLGTIPSSGAATTATAPQPAVPAPLGAPSGAANPAGLPAVAGAESEPASDGNTEPVSGASESIADTLAQPTAGQDAPTHAVAVHTAPAAAVAPTDAPAPVAKPQPAAPPPASQLAAEIIPLRSRDGEHTLTVHLHPLDLGPITVTAQVRGQDIQLNLGGATESGREALRAALPDLRRELEQAGFSSCLLNTGTGGAREDNRPAWLRQDPEARDEVSGPTATQAPATAAVGRSRTPGVLDLHA